MTEHCQEPTRVKLLFPNMIVNPLRGTFLSSIRFMHYNVFLWKYFHSVECGHCTRNLIWHLNGKFLLSTKASTLHNDCTMMTISIFEFPIEANSKLLYTLGWPGTWLWLNSISAKQISLPQLLENFEISVKFMCVVLWKYIKMDSGKILGFPIFPFPLIVWCRIIPVPPSLLHANKSQLLVLGSS